ncbi:MAG: FeoB-associated Cys-rich membrane protein [Sphingobacteriales bacterium]|nr:MAG: FeoB-associated Cys-rich membrane protein [Sphingobacteriales bacterium]
MWQELIVGLIVLAACVFLARRWLPFFSKKTTGCNTGCGGCGTPSTTACKTPDNK